MVLQCFNWIPHLLTELIGLLVFSRNKSVYRELPDDVIIDILSRLLAECVLEFQRVCRRWRLLTSSEYFIKLHLSRATPVIFVEATNYLGREPHEMAFFIFDESVRRRKAFKKLRIKAELEMRPSYQTLVDSCNGLLLFEFKSSWYVFNPVTQEKITIMSPWPHSSVSFMCGFFVHPLSGELKLLHVHSFFRYSIYTLGNGTWRKTTQPSFNFVPRGSSRPAIVNRALHWIVDSDSGLKHPSCANVIMVFRMDSEEFLVFPHPGKRCSSRRSHLRMELLVKEGHLTFCKLDDDAKTVHVWILEKYETWAWFRGWKLSLDLGRYSDNGISRTSCVSILKIQDGELWLDCCSGGLFVYHLDKNTVRKVGLPPLSAHGRNLHSSALYTKSLVRLSKLPHSNNSGSD